MSDVLHGSARTTARVRAELQASKETTGSLARRYGLSRTTVAKWWSRTTTADAPMGPRDPKEHGAYAGRGSDDCRVSPADAASAR
jgi:transposase-like protein